MTAPTAAVPRAGRLRVPRSRGALSGLLLLALGVWGALIPFVGPYFHYAYTPAQTWTWTANRFWLEVLPGVATIAGGAVLLSTANRIVAIVGGYLAAAAGAWFIVGPAVGQLMGSQGITGSPASSRNAVRVLEQLGFFFGLGAIILFLAAQAVGRVTVRSVRDGRAVARPAADERVAETSDALTYPSQDPIRDIGRTGKKTGGGRTARRW